MKKRKDLPLVSICIPNYNYESTIAETIESALNQTYPNIEIIVLDNKSTDGSYQIAKKYRKKGVRVYQNRKNIGALSHNKLIKMSRGAYVQILHSDDALEPTYVEECIRVMEKNVNVGVTVAERIEVNAKGEMIPMPPPFYNTSCIIPSNRQKSVLVMASYYVPSQTMMRRSVLEKTGLYEIDITYFMDWWMLYKCCCISDFAVVNKPLVRYRIWSSSDSSYMTKNMIMPLAGFLNRMCMIQNAYKEHDTLILEREQAAILKHADLTLKWGVSVIREGLLEVGKGYLHLAKAFDPEIVHSELYKAIEEFLNNDSCEGSRIDEFLQERGLAGARTKSYDPPEGYTLLNI